MGERCYQPPSGGWDWGLALLQMLTLTWAFAGWALCNHKKQVTHAPCPWAQAQPRYLRSSQRCLASWALCLVSSSYRGESWDGDLSEVWWWPQFLEQSWDVHRLQLPETDVYSASSFSVISVSTNTNAYELNNSVYYVSIAYRIHYPSDQVMHIWNGKRYGRELNRMELTSCFFPPT